MQGGRVQQQHWHGTLQLARQRPVETQKKSYLLLATMGIRGVFAHFFLGYSWVFVGIRGYSRACVRDAFNRGACHMQELLLITERGLLREFREMSSELTPIIILEAWRKGVWMGTVCG